MQDLRYAIRSLRKAPVFTAVAVMTLTLGIGAAVAVFTVVNAVLLRPLPVQAPDRLAIVNAEDVADHGIVGASWTKFDALRTRTTAFASLAAYIAREFTVSVGDAPAQVPGERVTADFFSVLGVSPVRGRSFTAAEDVDGAAPVAVITDAFWKTSLGADPDVAGRSIKVDGRETTIVGVLPPDFRFQFADREPQIFLTSVFTPGVMTAEQIRRGAGFLGYVGRLKDGVTFDAARRDLATFDQWYAREFGSFTDARKYTLHLTPLLQNLVGDVRSALLVVMVAVLLLLLIACANVAHLMLARAASRQREVAVRLALGASVGRLARQFLTESLLLAGMGAGFGVVAARIAVDLLVAHGPANIPRLADATPDARVVIFAVLAACATAVGFGLAPVLRVRGTPTADALKDGRSGGLTRGAGRLHRWIAISEAAFTLVLIIGAGLLFESLLRLQRVDIGFDPRHVYAAEMSLPRERYATATQRDTFVTQVLDDVRAQPGVDAAAATSYLPMGGSNYGFFFYIQGQPHLGPGRDSVTAVRHVTADYFRVMNIPVRSGRTFTDADTPASQPVALVNETFAHRFFGKTNPVGQHVANSGDGIMREIVGVVGDVKFDGPTRSGQQELYLPYRQVPWPSLSVVVSSRLPAEDVAGTLRRAVLRLDRDQAFAEIRPMPRVVASTTTQQQFTSALLATFAMLATALAAVGLYGVIALFVWQKRHEFGIRMALGAQRADVLWLVMREGGQLLAAGLTVGVIAALGASRALASLLFGVTATEPRMFVIGMGILTMVGLLAAYVPARRAVSVPPLEALRDE